MTTDQADVGEKREKLDAFKEVLKGAHHIETWTTVEDLRAKIAAALPKAVQADAADGVQRAGWYRGPAPGLNEFAALSGEVRDLRARLAAVPAPSKALDMLKSLTAGTMLVLSGMRQNHAPFAGDYALEGVDEARNVLKVRSVGPGGIITFPLDKLDTVYPLGDTGKYRVAFLPFG